LASSLNDLPVIFYIERKGGDLMQREKPRILLYAGKGGVGKTSIAAATGVVVAKSGLKTLVMSLDPAHSLSDAFDLEVSLMDKHEGRPLSVGSNLWIQELDIHTELENNWGEVHAYLAGLLNTAGLESVLAEELAVLPGMEEISALLYINQYVRKNSYDLIILDCAPTAESLRFVTMPQTLEWYMAKVFKLERNLMRMARPVASMISDVPLPKDSMYDAVEKLFDRLRGADSYLNDPRITSVRLVTNAEKMVLKETQRAFMFFRLHQLAVDAIIINRMLDVDAASQGRLLEWRKSQEHYLELAQSFFSPLPILTAPWGREEMLGYDRLEELGRAAFGDIDPTQVLYEREACRFVRENGKNQVILHLPFADKQELDLTKVGDELIIRAGNFKKSLILPRAFARLQPMAAHLAEDELTVDFGDNDG
jgi:arsenite-transporting ATPase